MTSLAGARVAIVGVGGMGIRHLRAARMLGAEVTALCDANPDRMSAALAEAPGASTHANLDDFIAAARDVDLVCVVTNTPSRASILSRLCESGAKRVLTEKPFTTNVGDARRVTDAYAAARIPLTVNTFRHFCDNHLRLRALLRRGELGELRHIAIQCASTGLGNMGSVFFDLMNFYVESAPREVVGYIDATGTPSPRGAQYNDPGGYGIVTYSNGARGMLDCSEDTGVPYTFHLVTSHGRVFIDELFDDWRITVRSDEDRRDRPLTFYLTRLQPLPFELTHGYDPVEMTSFSMAATLGDREEACNAAAAVTVMEMTMAMHVSGREGHRPVPLPLAVEHHGVDVAFA